MTGARVRMLFCAGSFLPTVGGLEVLAGELLPALHDRGFDVQVVTTRGAGETASDELAGIPIHRLEQRANSVFDVARMAPAFGRISREFRPDVVHAHDCGPFALLHLRTPPPRAPLVVTLHTILSGHVDGEKKEEITRRILRGAAWVTGVSQAVLDDVRRLEPETVDRSSVVHNGVRWPSVGPLPEAPAVLCVGRLSHEKGIDVALDAVHLLVRSGSDARVVFAGDGAAAPALRARAHELGLDDRVQFLGAVDRADLPRLFGEASVVAMPSRVEGLPLVAIEAAMSGRPIVATRVGGLPEIVDDGGTGLLVAPEDPEALAGALGALLADRARCASMGAAAREMALRDFSFEACVDGYEQLLRGVAADGALLP